jgi:hypothetical protein
VNGVVDHRQQTLRRRLDGLQMFPLLIGERRPERQRGEGNQIEWSEAEKR